MTPVEVLEKARALVARPGGWRRDGGYGTPECCCSVGALYLAVGKPFGCSMAPLSPELLAYNALLNVMPPEYSVARWQDEKARTQAEVVAAFDKAIALAKQALPEGTAP